MAVSGVRAAAAVREAMREAGLGFGDGNGPGRGVEGWAQPNYYNTLDFGLVPEGKDKVRWCVHLAGRPHLRYVKRWSQDGDETSEPVAPERLHDRVRAVFEGMDMTVREVLTGGFQGMWDDEVSYFVTTDFPEWLGPYDPTNAVSRDAAGPVLHSLAVAGDAVGHILSGHKLLPGYVEGNRRYLTREGVELLARTHTASTAGRPEAKRVSFAADGTLTLGLPLRPPSVSRPASLTNHWGDVVEAWPVPRWMFRERVPFGPDAPFVAGGETLEGLPFAAWDAQHGDDAPWRHAPSTPSP